MNNKISTIYIDPYGKKGAHEDWNKNFIKINESNNHRLINGIFPDSNSLYLLLNCIIVTCKFLFLNKSLKELYILAWPNRLISMLNFLSFFVKKPIYLIIHNNLERMKKNHKIKTYFNIIVLDSGLLNQAINSFDSPKIEVYFNPLPDIKKISHDDNIKKFNDLNSTFILYSFGIMDYATSVSIKNKLSVLKKDIVSRNSIFSDVSIMKKEKSYQNYILSLKSYFALIVLPCKKYRFSASGFILDCIACGLPVYLPNDFPLKFDILSNDDKNKIFYYKNEAELFLLLKN